MSQKADWAFDRTAERFFQQVEADGEKAYFWYFTVKDEVPDWEVSYRWKRFILDILDLFRHDITTMNGFRVIERQTNGRLHYHAIVNKRIPIEQARRIGARYGIGRMAVKKVWSPKGATHYLREYLSKDPVKGNGCRLKRWGTIGTAGHWAVKQSEVRIVTDHSKLAARIRKEFFPEPMPNWLILDIYRSWHAGYYEREEFICWYARENWSRGLAVAFEPLTWQVWLIQQEMDGAGERQMDGLIPF